MWPIVLPLLLWAIYFYIHNKEEVRSTVPFLLQYMVVALLFQLIAAAELTVNRDDISRSEIVDMLKMNVWAIGRNYFLGSVGLVLIQRNTNVPKLYDWENILSYFNLKNALWIVGVAVAYGIYAAIVIAFRNETLSQHPDVDPKDLPQIIFMSVMYAVNEEMITRLFIIGFVVEMLK